MAGAGACGSSGHRGSPRRAPGISPRPQPVTESPVRALALEGRCGRLPAEEVGRDGRLDRGEGFRLEHATLSGQLPVFLQEPHQNGVGMCEVEELALKLIGPFIAVEEVVAKSPNDYQHGEKLIARVITAAVEN